MHVHVFSDDSVLLEAEDVLSASKLKEETMYFFLFMVEFEN